MPDASSYIIPTYEKPYGISNTKASIPIVLELEKLNYDAWRNLFQTHCTGFGVADHPKPPSGKQITDSDEWNRIDSIVQMWIFYTIFEPLLQMVLKKVSSAHEMWSDLESLFRTNKDTKIIQLDNELHTIIQGAFDIASYCTRIKSITDMLDNIDSTIHEKNIVIYTINGLLPKFENVATIIRHSDSISLPSYLKSLSMLMDQEQRLKQIATPPNSNATSSSPTVLISEQQHQNINNPSSRGNFNHRGGRTAGRGRGRGGGSRGGRWSQNSSQHVHTPHMLELWVVSC
ncbi:hypothetical protein Lser_V15G41308 [Lactuca serriola]